MVLLNRKIILNGTAKGTRYFRLRKPVSVQGLDARSAAEEIEEAKRLMGLVMQEVLRLLEKPFGDDEANHGSNIEGKQTFFVEAYAPKISGVEPWNHTSRTRLLAEIAVEIETFVSRITYFMFALDDVGLSDQNAFEFFEHLNEEARMAVTMPKTPALTESKEWSPNVYLTRTMELWLQWNQLRQYGIALEIASVDLLKSYKRKSTGIRGRRQSRDRRARGIDDVNAKPIMVETKLAYGIIKQILTELILVIEKPMESCAYFDDSRVDDRYGVFLNSFLPKISGDIPWESNKRDSLLNELVQEISLFIKRMANFLFMLDHLDLLDQETYEQMNNSFELLRKRFIESDKEHTDPTLPIADSSTKNIWLLWSRLKSFCTELRAQLGNDKAEKV